jgi:hypothetical protein
MHLHLIEDDEGQLVDAIDLCSDFCHQDYCHTENLEYRGWNGCNESEFDTWCANCDVLIEGIEGEGY